MPFLGYTNLIPRIGHRVHTEVELAVVNSSEDYIFMCPLFSGGRAKNDQLRMLSNFGMQLVDNGMHASGNLPSMCTKKVGTLVPPLYVSTLWIGLGLTLGLD